MSLYFVLVKDLIMFIYYPLSNAILLAWLKREKNYQSCLSLNTTIK